MKLLRRSTSRTALAGMLFLFAIIDGVEKPSPN